MDGRNLQPGIQCLKLRKELGMRIIMKGVTHAKPNMRGLEPAHYQKE